MGRCHGSSQLSVVHTVEGYKNVMASSSLASSQSGFDLSFDLSVGVEKGPVSANLSKNIPIFAGSRSGSSSDTNKMSAFFSQEKGAVTTSSAVCYTANYEIQWYQLPPFRSEFLYAVKSLSDNPTTNNFKRFVQQYGSHFSRLTVMGAKLDLITMYTEEERLALGSDGMKKCTQSSSEYGLFFMKGRDSSAKCSVSSASSQTLVGTGRKRSLVSSFGAKPAATMDEWWKNTIGAPQPLKVQLESLVNLFTPPGFSSMVQSAKKHGIDFGTVDRKKVAQFLADNYAKYCQLFPDIDCSKPKGCGFNDDCKVTQKCIPGTKGAWTCEDVVVEPEKTSKFISGVHLPIGTYITCPLEACKVLQFL